MTAELLELPKVTPDYVNLGRLLTSRQTKHPLTIAEHQGTLSLSACENTSPLDYQLILEINNESVTIALEKQAISFLLPGNLDHQAVTALPNDLLMAALHYNFTPSLQQFAQLFGISANLKGLEVSNQQNSSGTGLDMTINIGGTVCKAQTPLCQTVFSLLNGLSLKPHEKHADLPVWAGLELGRTLLSADEIKSLELGDIVFLQQYVTGQHLIIRVNSQLAFLGEAEDSQITIQQRIAPMEEEQEHQEEHHADESQEGIDLSNIAIELLFEIGRQQFNASEVEQMQPGYIFDLDRPIEQPVRIRANGKVIAECQLVQIENRLGAKIIELKKG